MGAWCRVQPFTASAAARGAALSSATENRPLRLVSRHEDGETQPIAPHRWFGRGGLDKALSGVCVLVAACLVTSPFVEGFFDFRYWGATALAVLVLLAISSTLVPPRLTRRGAVSLGAAGALTAWAALSMSWAPSQGRAWMETNRLAFYGALLALVLVTGRSSRTANRALGTLGVGAGLFIAYIIGRLLVGSGPDLFFDHRLHGPVEYTNGEAGYLLMAFWLAIAAAERATNRGVQAIGVASAVMAGNLLVLTQSRAVIPAAVVSTGAVMLLLPGRLRRGWLLMLCAGAVGASLPWLLDIYGQRIPGQPGLPSVAVCRTAGLVTVIAACAAGLSWFVVNGKRATERLRKLKPVLAAALVLILGGLALVGLVSVGNPVTDAQDAVRDFKDLRVDQTSAQRFTGATGYRYDHWRIAVNQFRSHPLRGVGAGNFVSTYYVERRTPEPVTQPHSLPLQVLAELGLVGGLLLVAAVLPPFLGQRVPGPGRSARVLSSGGALACVGVFSAWLAHTSVDWLHNLPGLTGIAVMCGGLLLAAPLQASGVTKVAQPRARTVLLAVSLVIAAVAAASIGRAYAADFIRERAERNLVDDPEAALADSRRAVSLNPYAVESYYTLSAAYARHNRFGFAKAALIEAGRREPFNYVPHALLGDLATRRGHAREAKRYYARARRLNPKEPLLRPVP